MKDYCSVDIKSWTHDNLRPLTVMAENIHHKAMKRLSKESAFSVSRMKPMHFRV